MELNPYAGRINYRIPYPRDFIDIFISGEEGSDTPVYMRHNFYNIILDKANKKLIVFERTTELVEHVYDLNNLTAVYMYREGRLLSSNVYRTEPGIPEEIVESAISNAA